ncbi:MAG: hypothetical protein HY678_05845 [Chloroflexi bacterium]|nr:hypothetical protein [Chloroflexota bacterium]
MPSLFTISANGIDPFRAAGRPLFGVARVTSTSTGLAACAVRGWNRRDQKPAGLVMADEVAVPKAVVYLRGLLARHGL